MGAVPKASANHDARYILESILADRWDQSTQHWVSTVTYIPEVQKGRGNTLYEAYAYACWKVTHRE